VIAHVKFDWLIAQHEAESTLRVHVDRLLQIQFVERNDVLCRLHSFVFDDREVKLIVDHPVIIHKKGRAVFQEKLRDIGSFRAEDIERRRGCGR